MHALVTGVLSEVVEPDQHARRRAEAHGGQAKVHGNIPGGREFPLQASFKIPELLAGEEVRPEDERGANDAVLNGELYRFLGVRQEEAAS